MFANILFPVVIVGFIIGVIVISAIAMRHYEKKRTAALKDLADELNFEFSHGDKNGLLALLGQFHLFTLGHTKTMFNVLQGVAGGLQISIFDYRYVTGHGKHRHTWNVSVFVARQAGMELPDFSLRRESIWHKIGLLFGVKDINFESHPGFSRSYLLKGSDEEAIRATFQPPVLDYFEERPGLHVEGFGELLLYATLRRVKPDKFREFMTKGFEILKLFEPPAS